MDSKFTDKARKALRLSQEIATELGHNFVGTEHLLAALIKEGTSRASEALVEEGVTYDYIIENTEHVNFILDTYWLQVGGVSITDYINKASGRIECVHLKDYLPCYGEHGIKGRFAPVGEGNINWKAVIDCMKNAGTKHFFVEQDDACDYEDPFAQVKSSIDYLINNFGKV